MSRTSMLQQQLQLLVKALLARSPAYVWHVPLWKARPAWPARAAQAADWPRAGRSLARDLALNAASGEPAG